MMLVAQTVPSERPAIFMMVLPLQLTWLCRIALETASGLTLRTYNTFHILSRGATWVSLHNGGGVGWGEVVNGGFGLVLDGSIKQGEKAEKMLGKI